MSGHSILLVTPCFEIPGGIAGFYQTLVQYLPGNFKLFHIGARNSGESLLHKPVNLIRDVFRLFMKLVKNPFENETVVLNPSLIPFCTLREGLFLVVSKILGRRCIVFFHGWDNVFAGSIEKYFFSLFFHIYNKADAFIVLSREFEEKLRSWGFTHPIYRETTMVDDALIRDYALEQRRLRMNEYPSGLHVLFFSRIEKEKGIIETIDSVAILLKQHPQLKLLVAGTGSYQHIAQNHAESIGIGNQVNFLGWVSGQDKAALLARADILVLPSEREGMPICVLEAMMFGIPVVTTPVGAMNDFFKDGEFGFLLKNKNSAHIATLVDEIITNRERYSSMSSAAFIYAHDNFLASVCAERIEKICCDVSDYQ